MSDVNVVGLWPYSKCFFPDFSGSCTSRGTDMKRALRPGEIRRRGNIQWLSLREERCDRGRLAGTHLDHQVAACADEPRHIRCERAIGAQPIRPAVKRDDRIMLANFGGELGEFRARHI